MNEYIATFFTHYGAALFHRQCTESGLKAYMEPTPRRLSASCGVCVRFHADGPAIVNEHEDMERCYSVKDGVYTRTNT